ncbi:hypothetical protein [Actinomadura decatromicini]|uniref:Uncharacterized protein n=1 Tax=Actinomadura decatromicini TaxID=2604572 RepID=A0A5D3FD02_9ACTN|nr:hypothetical protein [Actinomadura decatromicini]TYK45195.1 hypothetical protein FXF68_31450 [Actinomadura decatromicini]
MSNPLNDIAPYPRRESEVTAESLARSLMVQAQANRHRMVHGRDADDAVAGGNRLVDVYGLVKLLKVLQTVAPDAADQVARDLWRDWHDGAAVWEWLDSWLRAAGIAPERVDAAAADLMRAAA